MKNLFYIALTFVFTIIANAQTTPAGENISLDQQLSAINQSTVTSGLIYERAVPIANLYNFNQSVQFNTANYPYFKQALLEMYKASNGTKFITVEDLKNLVAATEAPNEVDVALLNTQFQVLNYNEDNPSSGGLTYNTATYKFEPIAGKVPFYTMNTTVIAPTKETVSGTAITYKIRADLFFQNGTQTIKTLTANFGDGVLRTLIANSILTPQNIVVNYPTTGLKTTAFTITFADNSSLTTYGSVFFKYQDNTLSKTQSSSCIGTDFFKEDWPITAEEAFSSYDNSQRFKAQIQTRIFYHKFPVAAKTLLKPIIVIDGFDPGDKRKFEDCDCEADPNCNAKNQKDGLFVPKLHESFYDLMDYFDANGEKANLLEKLRDLGYDVILVNQPNYSAVNEINGQTLNVDGGADYIERNALALVSLIKQVNRKLLQNRSTSKLAVFGPSMGGQISRYALAYMEKKFAATADTSWKHNTYLWVSVDSPHLGANIPLGVQSLLNLVRGESDGAKEFYEKSLASPAAQQQLIEFHKENPVTAPFWVPLHLDYNNADPNQLNSQTVSQNMPINRGNSMFQQHYINDSNNGVANSKGWPINLRKIAMTNGSLTGSKETALPSGTPGPTFAADGERVLNLRGFQRVNIVTPLGSITWRTQIASLETFFLPTTGNTARICRFKKHFDDRTTNAPNYNSRGVMDNVPGGFLNAQALVFNDATANDPVPGVNLNNPVNWSLVNLSVTNIVKSISEHFGGSEWYLHEYNPIHSFIPTFSALAITNPNQNWNNPLNTNLTCPSNKQTPFDSYYGDSKNTEHTSFTYESVKWLLEELKNNPQAPHFPIQDGSLTGPDLICNSNSTYSFSDTCKIPSAATWTVSPNLQIVASTNYSVTVKQITNGQGTITATFQNGQTFTKTIWIGKPQLNQFTFGIGDNNPCIAPADCISSGLPSNEIYAAFDGMSTTEINTSSNWEWTLVNKLILLNGERNRRVICPLFVGNSGFKVRAKNACGWSDWVTYPTFEITSCATNFKLAAAIYSVYPNPSNDIVTIDLKNQYHLPEKNANVSGELYDMLGISRSKVEIKDNIASFSVLGLLKGIYVLKIYINDQVESHQIAVE